MYSISCSLSSFPLSFIYIPFRPRLYSLAMFHIALPFSYEWIQLIERNNNRFTINQVNQSNSDIYISIFIYIPLYIEESTDIRFPRTIGKSCKSSSSFSSEDALLLLLLLLLLLRAAFWIVIATRLLWSSLILLLLLLSLLLLRFCWLLLSSSVVSSSTAGS